jgi:hypothetical protein
MGFRDVSVLCIEGNSEDGGRVLLVECSLESGGEMEMFGRTGLARVRRDGGA